MVILSIFVCILVILESKMADVMSTVQKMIQIYFHSTWLQATRILPFNVLLYLLVE